MKKKIILLSLALAMCINVNAFADLSISKGVLDREFSKDRTVYYVELKDNEIPDITADGYEVIKKATSPAEKDKAVLSENVTILKDRETGIRYRFIFEKSEKSKISVAGVELSPAGKLTVSGQVSGDDVFKVIILKPEEKYSEKSVKWEELVAGEMEKGVLDIVEVKAEDIKNSVILEYTFPESAYSGNYGIVITGDNSEKDYNDSVYYMSEFDLTECINGLSEICKKEATEENKEALVSYINKNYKNLYLDLTYFSELSEGEKNKAAKLMFNAEGYADADSVKSALNKATTVAWGNAGKGMAEILDAYSGYFDLALFEEYKGLESKELIDEYAKECIDEAEFIKSFNKAVAISMINETEPENVSEILENVKGHLELDEEIYKAFLSNEDNTVRALCNKGFKTVDEIEEAIKEAVKNKSEGSQNNKKPSGGSGGGGYTMPSITPVVEPKEEIVKANTIPFDDLENYQWAKTAIEHMYINRIINGKEETKFAPGDSVKREEFVKIIVNGFDFVDSEAIAFEDVGNEWFREYIERGYKSGIITGVSETRFGVGENITREDMAVIIYRAVKKAGLELNIEIDEKAQLSDMDNVSGYAKEAVEFLVSKGAVKGSNGNFNPKAYATRAEAAQMIYNVIKIR